MTSLGEEEWARDRASFLNNGGTAPGPLTRQFADLTRTLLDGAPTTGAVLKQIVVTARAVIPGADLVSVTLRAPGGTFHTPVETDAIAVELDQLQYDNDEGPCLDAARPDGPAIGSSGTLAEDPQWPRFGPGAAARGYHSVVATALLPDARPPRLSGALNIYSRAGGAFTVDAFDIALLLATHASLALAHTNAVQAAELEVAHLRRAVEGRDVIGQAKGILMHRRRISADEAFDVLRRTSQDLNVKLADLARTIADRHTELDLPQ
jgi:GAF domain-containing protein